MTDEQRSRYCYPGTTILINNPGIKHPLALAAYERMVTKAKLLDLAAQPITGNFDLPHFQKIHAYLFGDIYPFAGKLRDEDIAKDGNDFAPHGNIKRYAQEVSKILKKADHFRDFSSTKFGDAGAWLLASLNYIHPAREGNGRTQREFIRTLALQAGYEMKWSRCEQPDLLRATLAAFPQKGTLPRSDALAAELNKAIVNRQPRKDLRAFYERLHDRSDRSR